jgi:hypothetical protein
MLSAAHAFVLLAPIFFLHRAIAVVHVLLVFLWLFVPYQECVWVVVELVFRIVLSLWGLDLFSSLRQSPFGCVTRKLLIQ